MYEVHGLKRRSSLFNTSRIDHLYQDPHEVNPKLTLHFGDLTDGTSIIRVIQEIEPDEIYNLGAMSHVKVSFDVPEYTANVDGIGTLRILEALRILKMDKKTKVFQASTSGLFGNVDTESQNEMTPFHPRSPYAIAKLYAYWSIVNYREAYGLFACNGILFNHESPIRGETFVTRKITRSAAKIAHGLEDKMYLGNLNAKRDWGHAKDYVEAMWLMLQQNVADDYVIATGTSTSVRDFIILCFKEIGVEIEFKGEGRDEKGFIKSSDGQFKLPLGKEVIAIDPYYFRPSDVPHLKGDPSKAMSKLNWSPKHDLKSLIKDMMSSDLELFGRQKYLIDGGYRPEPNE